MRSGDVGRIAELAGTGDRDLAEVHLAVVVDGDDLHPRPGTFHAGAEHGGGGDHAGIARVPEQGTDQTIARVSATPASSSLPTPT
jgi:hypothetical protein